MKNEAEQERIAYQKLLKAFNKLEAQYENIQDELNTIKNPNEAFDSMYSMDESAYGGSIRTGKNQSKMERIQSNHCQIQSKYGQSQTKNGQASMIKFSQKTVKSSQN